MDTKEGNMEKDETLSYTLIPGKNMKKKECILPGKKKNIQQRSSLKCILYV